MNNTADIFKTMSKLPGSLGAMTPLASASNGLRAGAADQPAFSQYLKQNLSAEAAAQLGAASGTQAGGAGAAEAAGAASPALDKDQAIREAQAEKAAGDLVSNALILPMLKQLRRSPWGQNTVFSPGTGEKAFGPQFDIQISDRIAHSPRLGIKKALAERILKRGQVNATSNPSTPSPNADIHGSLNVHG